MELRIGKLNEVNQGVIPTVKDVVQTSTGRNNWDKKHPVNFSFLTEEEYFRFDLSWHEANDLIRQLKHHLDKLTGD